MLHRDLLSLQQFRREEAEREERERIERERPLREAEEELAKTATELGKMTRDMILHSRDVDFEIPSSVAGCTMTQPEAQAFNAAESAKFIAHCADYFPCHQNFEAITDFLMRNGVLIADEGTFRAAYERLLDYGLLRERPEEQLVESEDPANEPTPSLDVQTGVQTYDGQDPATGLRRVYTKREVERMTADQFRRSFGLYGDDSPRFIYPTR